MDTSEELRAGRAVLFETPSTWREWLLHFGLGPFGIVVPLLLGSAGRGEWWFTIGLVFAGVWPLASVLVSRAMLLARATRRLDRGLVARVSSRAVGVARWSRGPVVLVKRGAYGPTDLLFVPDEGWLAAVPAEGTSGSPAPRVVRFRVRSDRYLTTWRSVSAVLVVAIVMASLLAQPFGVPIGYVFILGSPVIGAAFLVSWVALIADLFFYQRLVLDDEGVRLGWGAKVLFQSNMTVTVDGHGMRITGHDRTGSNQLELSFAAGSGILESEQMDVIKSIVEEGIGRAKAACDPHRTESSPVEARCLP